MLLQRHIQAHNLFGRMDMFFAEPVHGIIDPVMLAPLVGRHTRGLR